MNLPEKPRENNKLTRRRKIFADEYVLRWTEPKGAIAAYKIAYPGCSEFTATTNSARLLKVPVIADYIKNMLQHAAQAHQTSIEKIVGEMTTLAHSNILDYVDVDGRTKIRGLSRSQGAAVQTITTRETFDKKGNTHIETKLTLYDKRAALVDLGKHLGGFKVVSDVNLNVKSLEQLLWETKDKPQDQSPVAS
jgi:phage terminase small subunit